ncbi:transthyretin [Russula earlei]|uniref:Transthyretin n=1 Tax=Russula earlei TaxID=71964 RepID=A0ACC0UL88_9AGAM|nr:transthyretin [Russula earlei]
MSSSPITCHVLDSSIGKPAAGVGVNLHWQIRHASATCRGHGSTNADGRCTDLLSGNQPLAHRDSLKLEAGGVYKIVFETKDYFDKAGKATFYPWVEIPFIVTNPDEHHHIPLLISPFSYTTYRGS